MEISSLTGCRNFFHNFRDLADAGLDFAALAMALRAAGYDGPVILEPYANLFREEAELADSLAYLRKTMEIASQKTANRV